MQSARQKVVEGRGGAEGLLQIVPARESSVQAVAERRLLDEVARAERRGAEIEALAVRLSRLGPAGGQAHHRRIARAVLDDAAARGSGQVFALRNQDLVLFGPKARGAAVLLGRLFGGEAGIVQVLALGPALAAYVEERFAEKVLEPARADSARQEWAVLPALAAAEAMLRETRSGDLLQAQVAALVLPDGALQPLFREALPRLPALAARLQAAGAPGADPYLFQHLASRLDERALEIACMDLAQGGPMTGSGLALHVNLTLSGVFSQGFARLAAAMQARGARGGVEILLMEACADPAGFARAAMAVRAAGLALVLDGVGRDALRLTHPGRLGADLVKVDWSDGLAGAETDAAMRELGPDRVMLVQADGEAALRWGLPRGVRRFQGRHIDAVRAAGRLASCEAGQKVGCTMRLCAERASATSGAGRMGCRNLKLLDLAGGEAG